MRELVRPPRGHHVSHPPFPPPLGGSFLLHPRGVTAVGRAYLDLPPSQAISELPLGRTVARAERDRGWSRRRPRARSPRTRGWGATFGAESKGWGSRTRDAGVTVMKSVREQRNCWTPTLTAGSGGQGAPSQRSRRRASAPRPRVRGSGRYAEVAAARTLVGGAHLRGGDVESSGESTRVLVGQGGGALLQGERGAPMIA